MLFTTCGAERKDWMFPAVDSNDRKLDLESAAVITEPRAWRLEDFKEFKGKRRVSFTENPPADQKSENQTLDLSITETTYAHQ